jgi:hypothetical protein
MRTWHDCSRGLALVSLAGLMVACLPSAGCGAAQRGFEYVSNPFTLVGGSSGTTGVASSGRSTGTTIGSGTSGFSDPCSETANRKFIRISMRNQSSSYIHYFLVLIAYVNGTEYPDGAVCPTDTALYQQNGYTLVASGATANFGSYCIRGPALYQFYQGGRFRTAAGASGGGLASAIAPAQGTTPTYDGHFTSAGATVPVPNLIIFHNPGSTTEGQALKISRSSTTPCVAVVSNLFDPICQQDSFYYVDDTNIMDGSTTLGLDSGRRVPSEIQGTGCECLGTSDGAQSLAASDRTAANAGCNEFLRGGRIDYVFVRDQSTEPAYPQLLWRVTDSASARAHDYDSRANVQ